MKRRELLPPAVVVLLLCVIVVSGFCLRGRGNDDWLRVIEVGISGVLSLSLVFVYLWQNRILREQRRVMSAGYSPVVSVQDLLFSERSASEFPGGSEGPVQAIQVTARNRGNDIASDLKLRCILDCQTDNSTFCSTVIGSTTAVVEPRTVSFQVEDESNSVYRGGGPALPPTMEEPATLYAHVGVEYQGHYCSIPDATDIVISDGADDIRLGFILKYTDASGDTYSVLLGAYHVRSPNEGIAFDEIVEEQNRIPRHDLSGQIDSELSDEP